MNRSQRAREAWDLASDAHDVARLAARVRRVARDATADDRRPPLASAAADWAAWLAAREAAAAAQRAEDAADAAAAAAEYAAEAAELAVAWEPRKETGCASAHESCGGLPAGTESDTEDTEPGGAP